MTIIIVISCAVWRIGDSAAPTVYPHLCPHHPTHLAVIEKKYYALIRDTIAERLTYEPDVPNLNRKPLTRTAFGTATWEIRFGPENTFRVFYAVKPDEREVYILAIGIKIRETLIVGSEEIDL